MRIIWAWKTFVFLYTVNVDEILIWKKSHRFRKHDVDDLFRSSGGRVLQDKLIVSEEIVPGAGSSHRAPSQSRPEENIPEALVVLVSEGPHLEAGHIYSLGQLEFNPGFDVRFTPVVPN